LPDHDATSVIPPAYAAVVIDTALRDGKMIVQFALSLMSPQGWSMMKRMAANAAQAK
jgi:hypothetical protein